MYRQLLPLFLSLLAVAVAAPPAPSQEGGGPPPTVVPPGRIWSGKWIWTPGESAPRNSYTHFRKAFTLGGVPKEARVHLTADSRYQLFVNGKFIGRGPVRSDRRWLYYDTWDVTPELRKGKNVLAVLVHHYGEFTFQYMQGRGGLIADLVGTGDRDLAHTGADWKAQRSAAWGSGQPRMSIQLGFNEVFDANREPRGWKETELDDGGWQSAVEVGPAGMEPWPHLVPRDIPKMRERPAYAARVLETAEVRDPLPSQHVDLLPLMDQKNWAVAYLATSLQSPDRRQVELRVGSDDAVKVWLNGKLVISHLIERGAAPDQEAARVTLEPGENRLLAKVVQGHSKWEFYYGLGGSTAGVRQLRGEGEATADGRFWRLAGPFTYPMAAGLRGGFDTVFPPERNVDERARFRNGAGAEFGWREVVADTGQGPSLVSQLMARESRGPLDRVRVRDADRLITSTETPVQPNGSTQADVPPNAAPKITYASVTTAPGAGASFLVDFGREVTGFPRVRVRGAKGGEILDMGYGEVLQDPAGAYLPQSGERIGRLNPDRDGVHYADRFTCRPGDQQFQTFDKRAFRYLLLDVRNAPAGLDVGGVELLFATYPVENRGAFNCSDDRLNQIWNVGRYTCQLNMEDGYTDCPWRERGQWWGDARVEGLINYYCFGDRELIRKCLRQQGQSMNAEGMTWGVYPTDWDGGRLPSFTLIWVSTLWDYYEHTGDAALVRELYPKVRYTLDHFFAPRVSKNGLLKDVPYWVFIDWAPVDTAGEGGALNAYYYDALRRAAEMGRLIGADGATDYSSRAEAVKQALNRHLWDPQAHAYRDSIFPSGEVSPKISQQTNSLCVLFDIAPQEEQARILDTIYAPAGQRKVVEAGSPYFSYYQLAALFHTGRHDQALAYIRRQWGRMLDWGATTWWEMWSPGASFCHGWSGGPTYNLGAEVLGVKPLKAGFSEVLVEPHWVGLTYASGIVPLEKGELRTAWQRDASTRTAAVSVEAPKDVAVEVVLPGEGTVRVNGKAALPKGVEQLQGRPGTTRFRVAGGRKVVFELKER